MEEMGTVQERLGTQTFENKEKESPEEKFSRLAPKRTDTAVKKIQIIGNLAGSGYRYSEEQAQEIISQLRQAVDEVEGKFNKRLGRLKGAASSQGPAGYQEHSSHQESSGSHSGYGAGGHGEGGFGGGHSPSAGHSQW